MHLEQVNSSPTADESKYLTNQIARQILKIVGVKLSRLKSGVQPPMSWSVWRGHEDIFTIARGRIGPNTWFFGGLSEADIYLSKRAIGERHAIQDEKG